MPIHKEKRSLPYSAEQMFALVADVNLYPEFLPWCLASRITKNEGDTFYADLIIGYKMIREKFTSKVVLKPKSHIHVEYIEGPMKYLSNHWKFEDQAEKGCMIDFYLEFEFKNKILENLMGAFFEKAFQKMVLAFEKRASELYDSPSKSG
jgi:coenzyme Q-binding protein COQ10